MKTKKAPAKICARCGRLLAEGLVRPCPHPVVRNTLGENICYYCCKKCKHHTTIKYCGAIGCGYKNDDTEN